MEMLYESFEHWIEGGKLTMKVLRNQPGFSEHCQRVPPHSRMTGPEREWNTHAYIPQSYRVQDDLSIRDSLHPVSADPSPVAVPGGSEKRRG